MYGIIKGINIHLNVCDFIKKKVFKRMNPAHVLFIKMKFNFRASNLKNST